MLLPNALATLLSFLPSESSAGLSVPSTDSNPGIALQLGAGVTYGGDADEDGDIDVDNPYKGFEISAGVLSASPARPIFVDAQIGYSPKAKRFLDELSLLRFHFVAGPKVRVGTESNFRVGLGLGVTKAFTDGYGGVVPSFHALIGYYFPLDDYIGGLSLNYSRTLGKLYVSQKTQMWWGETSTLRRSIRLHDLALKFEWHIPVGSGGGAR